MNDKSKAPTGQGSTPGRPIPDMPLARHVNHTPFWSQYYQSVDMHGDVFHTVVTPVGSSVVPIPYAISHKMDQSEQCSNSDFH